MNTIDVSYSPRASYDRLIECLSPENILESAEIYSIESFEKTADSHRVTVSVKGEELIFDFSEIDNGYEYTLVDSSGLFAERTSKLTVYNEEETVVYAETHYSFDSMFSFVLDRLAARSVRRELQNTIANLDQKAFETESNDE